MRLLTAALILLCLAIGARAQLAHPVKGPRTAAQRATLEQVRANLSEYEQHLPGFVCTAVWKPEDSDIEESSGERRNNVIVDLDTPDRGKPSVSPTTFAVEPLLRDLFTSNVKFVFTRFAKIHRKRAAVYSYKKKSRGGIREAEFYVDQDTGVVSRIVFEDVDTPERVPLFCRPRKK